MNDGTASGNASDVIRRQHLRAMIVAAQSAAADARSRGSEHGRRTPAIVPSPDAIPGYALLGELHRGGQGVVYQGIQESTKRKVAIKVMKEGPFAGSADRARFEREIRILGALQDRRIAAIHNSGVAAGSQYFVMDFIAGAPLDVYGAGPAVTVRDRVALFVQICEAVNTAHLLGIVHRDLKPGNILIDEAGDPHVLDFGLAKSVTGGVRGQSLASMTVTGQFVGSLPWAAPEQLLGEGFITPRTDVYSLGVLLYQILTGRFPYPIAGAPADVFRHIQTTEPVRPRAIRRDMDDELDTIVLKCLAKEPERRYASAGELGRDLEHYLRGEPIDAKRDSGWYVLRKTLRRYRTGIVVAATFMLLVTVSAVSLTVLYGRQGVLLTDISRERDRARQAERAEKQGRHRAEYESYMANIAAADAALASDDGGAALRRLSDASNGLRNWEWRFLKRAADSSIATIQGPPNQDVRHIRISPDGRFLAGLAYFPGAPSQLLVWDRMAPAPVLKVTIGDDTTVPYFVRPYQFSDGDDRLRLCPGDGSVVEYDLENGREVRRRRLTDIEPTSVTWMAAPHVFVSHRVVGSVGHLRYWSDIDKSARGDFPIDIHEWISAAAATSDGTRIAIAQYDGTACICTLAPDPMPISFRAHDSQVYGICFSPDGQLLATSAEDGLINVWTLEHDSAAPVPNSDEARGPVRRLRTIRCSTQRVFSIDFSPDGTKIAAAAADKALSVWNVRDGKLLRKFRGHAGMVSSVAFHPDGRHIVTGSYDETLKLWDLKHPRETTIRRELPGIINNVNFDADGTRLMVGTSSGPMVLDSATSETTKVWNDMPGAGYTVFDRSGSRAIVDCHDGTIRVIDLSTGHESHRFMAALPNVNLHLALNPEETQIACSDARTQRVTLRDVGTGAEKFNLVHPLGAGLGLAYGPDGSTLATGSKMGELFLWDSLNGQRIWSVQNHPTGISTVAFSPDGRRIATASEDSTIQIHDAKDGHVQRTLRPQMGDIWSVAFSPDGTRLAAGGRDRTVRIFDADTGCEILALRGPTGTVMTIAFSPDGRRLAAGSWAREIFIWDAGLK